MVQQAVGANPRTVVLVNSGSGIRMTGWADKAAAILYGWYPGQNGFLSLIHISRTFVRSELPGLVPWAQNSANLT